METHTRRGLISTLAACAALLLAGCSMNPFHAQDDQQDERFAEFTEYVPEELTVQSSLDSATQRMPAITATEVHFVGQYRVNEGESRLPEPDRPYWFHAVISTDPSTTRALDEASTGPATLLPPVHPDLHQYVPQHCTFTTVPQEQANQILDTENAQLEGGSERFTLDKVTVSTDCNLLILTGTGSYS